MKNYAELENFSGITDVAVRQDFYATLFNLAQMEVFVPKDAFDKNHNRTGNKYLCGQSLAQAIGEVKFLFIKMFSCRSKSKRWRFLNEIKEKLLRSATIIRPGRSYPRQVKHVSSKYHNCKKRVL